MTKFALRIKIELKLYKIYCESYFEQQKTGKDFKTSSTNKLFAYAMRGLGLLELWVLAGTSVAGDRCPTLSFKPKPKWDFFVYLKKILL